MTPAHIYACPYTGRVQLFLPVGREWIYVDWRWLLASLNTGRWIVHHDPTFANAAVESMREGW